ncbi:MAG: alpha/beta fold hydrolase [Clostridiales bacterium]|nr:alpha/beta fold hydrolase [Clostridiales bacterium]
MKNKIGCLIIHGFGGSPEEVNPLAEYLHTKGITTLTPVLEGHTGEKTDLLGVSYKQWIESGKNALNELSRMCKDIFVIGFSMGGLVAASLPNLQKIKGIATLNTPIYPCNFGGMFKNIMQDIRNGTFENLRFYAASSAKLPFSTLIEFLKFLHNAKPKFKNLRCPLFVAQALEDDVVQPKSAIYIHRQAPSVSKTLKFYKGAGHLICYSAAASKLFGDVLSFILGHSLL